jgi:hypothetical protein
MVLSRFGQERVPEGRNEERRHNELAGAVLAAAGIGGTKQCIGAAHVAAAEPGATWPPESASPVEPIDCIRRQPHAQHTDTFTHAHTRHIHANVHSSCELPSAVRMTTRFPTDSTARLAQSGQVAPICPCRIAVGVDFVGIAEISSALSASASAKIASRSCEESLQGDHLGAHE